MADPQFFKRAKPLSLDELAKRCAAKVAEGSNPDFIVEDVAALSLAKGHMLSFLDNKKYKEQLTTTNAGAVIIHESHLSLVPQGVHVLLSAEPYKSYALAAQAFYPDEKPEAQIDEHAIIDPSSKIGRDATIEAGVIIKAGAEIGDHAWLQAGCVIGENVKLGNHVRIGEKAVLSHTIIGNNVRLYPGACVGQDGFGFAIDPSGFIKVPQLGRVLIEDHVQIGASTTIDRGAGPDTIIGAGTWIDNLVQIGHNVKIGRGCILVAGCGIAGSTELGDFVVLGGQVGIAGHLRIGSGVRIGAQSGITRDIPAGAGEFFGTPAQPIRDFMKQHALLKRLIKKSKSA